MTNVLTALYVLFIAPCEYAPCDTSSAQAIAAYATREECEEVAEVISMQGDNVLFCERRM